MYLILEYFSNIHNEIFFVFSRAQQNSGESQPKVCTMADLWIRRASQRPRSTALNNNNHED